MKPFVRGLLMVLICSLLQTAAAAELAAVLPDPAASLAPRDLIAALAALRQPYAERPTDSDVTGRIVLCYVGLCLSGWIGELASSGPWLDHARIVVQERQAARGGKPPRSWAEAKPELWVAWLGGDAQAAIAGLATWAEASNDPLGQALRAYAQNERGTLTEHDGPWARMAWLWIGESLTNAARDPRLDSLQVNLAPIAQDRDPTACEPPVRQWVADIAWMLRSRDLTDAVAVPRLQALAAALGANAAETDRATLIRAVEQAARRAPVIEVPVLAAGLEALDVALDGQGGFDGKTRILVGLRDVAQWLADRSVRVLWLAMSERGWSDHTYRALGAPLAARCPTWPSALRMNISDEGRPAADRLVALLKTELQAPRRISPRRAASLLYVITKTVRADAFPALTALVDQRLGVDEPAALFWLGDAAARTHTLAWLAPRLRYALAHGYRNLAATWYAHRIEPGPLLDLAGLTPTETWIDATVDNSALPWPQLGAAEHFAVVWRGFVNIDQAGVYQLAIESDDGSRLRLDHGGMVDNAGDHAMQQKQSSFVLNAGWHGLTLEFEQGGGGAGCRLLWSKPGTTALEVIPATALAHGDTHAPGLAASGYQFVDAAAREQARAWRPSPVLVAAATDPGFFRLHAEFCRRAQMYGQSHYAVHSARILGALAKAGQPPFAPGFDSGFSAEVALMVLLEIPHEDPDVIRALIGYLDDLSPISIGAMVQDPDRLDDSRRYWFDVSQSQRSWLLNRILSLGYAAELAAHLQSGKPLRPTEQVMLGACALELGDLPTAQRNLAAAMVDRLNLNSSDLSRRILEWAILDRTRGGNDADWPAVMAALAKHQATPDRLLAARWLSGELPWAEAQNEIQQTADGDCLNYYRGIYEITLGQYDAASTRFTAMIAQHPNWEESRTAGRLNAWIATLTPAQRAQAPQAKPLASDTATPAQSNF